MMSKYGFSEEDEAPEAIVLPKPKPKANKPPATLVAEAVKAGEGLGFVSREPRPAEPVRRSGRRRGTEPKDNLLISGPARVIDAFRSYCDDEKIPSYWQGIEQLLALAAKAKQP